MCLWGDGPEVNLDEEEMVSKGIRQSLAALQRANVVVSERFAGKLGTGFTYN
jgi:hypothetical protein